MWKCSWKQRAPWKKNIEVAKTYENIPYFNNILRKASFPKPAAVDLLGLFNVLLFLM